jgi:hypothetical protein
MPRRIIDKWPIKKAVIVEIGQDGRKAARSWKCVETVGRGGVQAAPTLDRVNWSATSGEWTGSELRVTLEPDREHMERRNGNDLAIDDALADWIAYGADVHRSHVRRSEYTDKMTLIAKQ